MPDPTQILPIEPTDISRVLGLKWDVFRPWYATREECDAYTLSAVDWSMSIKLVHESEIVGIYLLGRGSPVDALVADGLRPLEDLGHLAGRRGIQAVTLAIDPRFRGFGWGSLLKDHVEHMDIDFWWGLAFKTLGNRDQWLKRSRVVAESDDLYMFLWERASESGGPTGVMTAAYRSTAGAPA